MSSAPTRTRRQPRADRRWVIAGGTAVVGTALTTIGLTQRTLWLDESATIAASTSTLAQLHELIGRIDLVHATYYVLMHAWFAVVGYSPFTLRFPSAVAVGLTAALIVLLGARLLRLGVGVAAAFVFLLLPVTATAGTTGRSSALEMLLATLATLVLVHAVDASRSGASRVRTALLWAGWAIVSYVAVLVFLWSALVVAAHLLAVGLVFLRDPRRRWPVLVPAAVAAVVLVVAVLPFARAAQAQSGQIGFLLAPTLRQGVESALRVQFFGLQLVASSVLVSTVLAVIGWLLAVVGTIAAARWRSAAVAVLLPWLLLPTLVLIGVSRYIKPVYTERYVAFSAPALALLVGAGLVALLPLLRGAVSAVLAVALVLTAGVLWIDERWGAPLSTDFGSAAATIEHERADETTPAGLLLGKMHRPADQLTIDYPDAVDGLRPLAIAKPAVDVPYFFADLRTPEQQVARTGSLRTVWYVGDDPTERASVVAAMRQQGFRVDPALTRPDVFVVEFTR